MSLFWLPDRLSQDYSVQSRPRIYLLAVFSKDVLHLSASGLLTAEKKENILSVSWVPEVFELLSGLTGSPNSLSDFLLDDAHDEVREWVAHRMKVKTEQQEVRQKSNANELKFEEEHLELFNREGFKWPPDESTFKEVGLAGKLDHLPRRFAERAYFHTALALKKGNLEDKQNQRVVDLNMRFPGFATSGPLEIQRPLSIFEFRLGVQG